MLRAYHNSQEIKDKYIARFAAHVAADEVIRGIGFNPKTNKGCFVGCTLNNYKHSQFPVELGWPEWLARLADAIFEGLETQEEATQFGIDLLEAVNVGADLEPVKYRLAIWRHEVQLLRLAGNDMPYAEKVRSALRNTTLWLEDSLGDTFKNESAAESARSAAESARSAAQSAAESARSAAESAAWSAAWSARSAAESAQSAAQSAAESARSAAESAAWSARSAAESAESAAQSARSAARSAAESAAWSARSAAESVAESAWSAAESAWSAADSAWSAAWSAQSAAYTSEKEMLLQLIRQAR